MNSILTPLVAGSLLAALATAQPQPRYTVIDLGILGGTYSFPYAINNSGMVAGGSAIQTRPTSCPKPRFCGFTTG